MSIALVENTIRDRIINGEGFVTKFVDIGKGSGKLNNGVLQAEKSDKYIQALSNKATFLDKTKLIPSHNHKRQLDMMSFDIELEAGRINGTPQTLSDAQHPTFTDASFDAEELRALTGLHRTVLYDSIEGKNFMNTLTNTFAETSGLALERILLYGDKNSSDSSASSGYKVIDGIVKKVRDNSDIPVEEIDLTATDSNPLNELRRMIDLFPDKYQIDGGMACFVPPVYRRTLHRFVADNKDKYGDVASITTDGTLIVEDIPIIAIPQFSTLRNGFTKKPILLTHKENIQWLADPDNIMVESQFMLRSNTYDIASTMYADINFAFKDATSLAWLKEA